MVAAELPGLIVPALPIVKLATNTSQQPPRCNSQARSLNQQLWNGVRFALLVIQVSSYLIYRPLLSNLRIFARRCLVVVTALCRPRFACPLTLLSGFTQLGFELDGTAASLPFCAVVLLSSVFGSSWLSLLPPEVKGPAGGVSSSGEFNKLPAVLRLDVWRTGLNSFAGE